MNYQYSIVIPTRHRPEFIKESLKYIALQTYPNYEVIVCDNFVDPALSCKKYFDEAGLVNSLYVRPEQTLGMVQNWNFAIEHASGDYILLLTDKMFLLPNTLSNLNRALQLKKADIVNWADNMFTPLDYGDYFGAGHYAEHKSKIQEELIFEEFDPLNELNIKGSANVARTEQDKSTYIRGKICFGAYSKELVKRLKERYTNLFFDITPDYTSMILALSEAKNAIELREPGIVHLNTDLSNGGLCKESDTHAKRYIEDLNANDEIYNSMLVKNLYSSVNNMLTSDYQLLRRKYNLMFTFDEVNWLTYIYEDIFDENKIWSSSEIEQQHKGLFWNFVKTLPKSKQDSLQHKIKVRGQAIKEIKLKIQEQLAIKKDGKVKRLLKKTIFYALFRMYLEMKNKLNPPPPLPGYFPSLREAVLTK